MTPIFPNDPKLLFLVGDQKKNLAKKKNFGLVGVDFKVVLFSSEYFRIKARDHNNNSLSYQGNCVTMGNLRG